MKSTRNVSDTDCKMNFDTRAEYLQYRKEKCKSGGMQMKGKYMKTSDALEELENME